MEKETILRVGVCEGRHPLPCDYYVFKGETGLTVAVIAAIKGAFQFFNHINVKTNNYYSQEF